MVAYVATILESCSETGESLCSSFQTGKLVAGRRGAARNSGQKGTSEEGETGGMENIVGVRIHRDGEAELVRRGADFEVAGTPRALGQCVEGTA